MSENVAKCSEFVSDQRIAISWPKSYLLVFIIIVKAWVIPTKTDWNAMNLTRLGKKRNKERKKSDKNRRWRRKQTKRWGKTKSQLLAMVSEPYPLRFELEIVISRLPCGHPYNHFAVLWRLNQKWQNRTESVCAKPLFVIPACETKICAKNSNISSLISWYLRLCGACGWVYRPPAQKDKQTS